jgi:hypothetical protein
MINTSREEVLFLEDEDVIVSGMKKAFDAVIAHYQKMLPERSITKRTWSKWDYSLFCFERIGTEFILGLELADIDLLVRSQFRASELDAFSLIKRFAGGISNESLGLRSDASVDKFQGKKNLGEILKLALIHMWTEKLIILPLAFPSPRAEFESEVLFDFIYSLNCENLTAVWSTHPHSGKDLKIEFDRDKIIKTSSHWCRFVTNTTFYSLSDVTDEDIRQLIRLKGDSFYSRYYLAQLLSVLATHSEQRDSFGQRVDKILLEHNKAIKEELTRKLSDSSRLSWSTGKMDNRKKRDAKPKLELNRENYLKFRGTEQLKNAPKKFLIMNQTIDYGQGSQVLDPADFWEKFFAGSTFSQTFGIDNGDVGGHPVYKHLDEKVQSFASLIWPTFSSLSKSKRNQNDKDLKFARNVMLAYVAIYLPAFFRKRDGDLSAYPQSFNEFECGVYIVRDEYIDKLIHDDKELPPSLFKFLEGLAEAQSWINDTHFARAVQIRQFCEYVELKNAVLPNADKFANTIVNGDMPLTSKRTTTAKKFLPRRYFKTFLSMLESFDYLVEHINGMAKQENPALINGSLKFVSHFQLYGSNLFNGIWGSPSSVKPYVDTDLLNYTPIIYHDGKCYPINKIRRFYKLDTYETSTGEQTRILPHAPRISLLMCHTGIRQRHLLWLDKDRFDLGAREKNSGLQPLIVSTDKSHGEWIAVVSREVIELCRKQKQWYEECKSESFSEPVWYGNKEGSKFGKFRPLFRQHASDERWDIYKEFPKLLLSLEIFMKEQIGDNDFPELVRWVPTERDKFKGRSIEHALTHEEYEKGEFDASWRYRVQSDYTPHGLRSAFVSEAIRFLPPALVGSTLTGQTESLVWYYAMFDETSGKEHFEMLMEAFQRNHDDIEDGDAPELAKKLADLNNRLISQMKSDPAGAIDDFGLISLAGVTEDKCGIEIIRAKKHGVLAFNSTHICPFNNTCPKEVIKMFGLDKPCSLCPYAVRGKVHLDAINAEKLKNEEMIQEYALKINAYRKRPSNAQVKSDLETLEKHLDNATREAAVLEVIEQQLERLYEESSDNFIVTDKDTLKKFFKATQASDVDYLLKRLIDAQVFPDTTTATMRRKLAFFRHRVTRELGVIESLGDYEQEEHVQFGSLLKSISQVAQLSTKDMYNLLTKASKPQPSSNKLSQALGIEYTTPEEK